MVHLEMTRKRIMAIADHYGLDPQLDMLVEEMAELIQAISKRKRGQEVYDNLVEEISDVELLIEQVIYLLGCDSEVNDNIKFKSAREIGRIVERGGQIGYGGYQGC